MAFSWKHNQKEWLKKLKIRDHIYKQNGRNKESQELQYKIKKLETP